MSWIKSGFGENDDKQKNPPDSIEEGPKQKVITDYPGQMIAIEELYRREEMHILEDVTNPKAVIQQPTQQPSQGPNRQPNVQTKKYGANPPKGGIVKSFVPKPVVIDTKLTIILIENTNVVAEQEEKLKAIVKSLVTTEKVCVINYGSIVRQSKIVEAKDFNSNQLLDKQFVGESSCLFDAILTLGEVVKENHKKSRDFKFRIERTQSIDIIGIGRCFDNCSITSSDIAKETFSKVAKNTDVITKYFCLSEKDFIATAEMGFRSIGAIARNYM